MKNKFLFIFLFLILLINACAKIQQQPQIVQQTMQKTVPAVSAEDGSILTPEQVVILYFQAWNDEQYDVMYSLISDGFKQIEPTAKTFDYFKSNMEKFYDTALGVSVLEAKESYKTDNEAGVDYTIEITRKDGNKREFSSVYTLKKRTNGWKLIHPYGENIDTS
ncbi:MAG: NTF2-like N-terminal transpeptidase domain-containing protein [Nanoarchaeota archaeon]|nr:NTF2-like N-terminal transpeptidase domain-containing protein [Nanoarchaeota archaeon]